MDKIEHTPRPAHGESELPEKLLGAYPTSDNEEAPGDVPAAGPGERRSEIDGGWGWMVVLGCMIMHLLLGGWTRCYGIFYLKMIERFNSSAAITAWVGGVGTAVRMGASPVATALSRRFSVKLVGFVGGLLLFLGICMAGFGTSIEFMFLPIGIIAGIGGTLVYSPAIVHVGHYFEKKRGIATGLSTAGSGLGVFAFPPIVEFLFSHYSFTGTFLIVGASMLNTCVAALLYRPLRPQTLKRIETATDFTKEDSHSGSQDRHSEVTGLRKYIDYTLMSDFTFLSFGISMGLVTTAYISAQILVPAQAVHLGVDETRASLLLSVIGIADTIGRLSSGFLFDIRHIRPMRTHIYNFAMLLTGISIYGWGFSTSFEGLLVSCMFHGLVNGLVVSQRAVIIADVMGLDKLSSAFGLTVFCQGVGALVGPLVAGMLRDVTGDYVASFIFTGTCSVVAFFVIYAGNLYSKCKNSRERKGKHISV